MQAQPLQQADVSAAATMAIENQNADFQALLARDAKTTAPDITFNDGNFARAERLAKLMASGAATVPKHLRGNVADCFAIVLQTFAWGLNNPFAVASKTHVINDLLCYEAQLLNAVIQSSGVISGHFHYEYKGEGSSLECRVGGVISGDDKITWGEWLANNSVTTRNSPLWKTNPKQQLGYLQVKNWARAFYPGAILGVYTTDELFDGVGSQYDQIKAEDLSTPESEALSIIEKINSAQSWEALQLIKPEADLVKGEIRKRVIEAFRVQKKALIQPKEELSQTEPDQPTTEIDNAVIVDNNTGEMVDQYDDMRLAIKECDSLSDLARLLKDCPAPAKEALKNEISQRQDEIKAAA